MNEVLFAPGPLPYRSSAGPMKVMSVFGTRPDLIKFLPVLRELDRRDDVDGGERV